MARNRNSLIFLFLFSFTANIFHGTEGASKAEIKTKLESIDKSIETIYTKTFPTSTSVAPVTGSSTSATPVTSSSTTVAPVTNSTTVAPVTNSTTVAPVTNSTTVAPVTNSTTVAPVTNSTTVAPVTNSTTIAPVTNSTTVAPVTGGNTTAASLKLRRQRRSVALWQARLAQVAEGDTDGCGSLNSTECYKNAVKQVNGELENIKNKKYGEVKIENLNEADKKLKELASKTIDNDLKTYVQKNKDQIDDLKKDMKTAEDVVDSSARTISGGVVGVLAGIALLLL